MKYENNERVKKQTHTKLSIIKNNIDCLIVMQINCLFNTFVIKSAIPAKLAPLPCKERSFWLGYAYDHTEPDI